MDELAWALKLDPVELRLKNEAKEHQRKDCHSRQAFCRLSEGWGRAVWLERQTAATIANRDGK